MKDGDRVKGMNGIKVKSRRLGNMNELQNIMTVPAPVVALAKWKFN